MNQDKLKGLRVAILAADGFEQSELTEPRKALDEAGARTTVVSPKQGSIRGWSHKEWGGEVEVDEDLKSAKPGEYDALLLPGGVMNPDTLRTNASAVAFVKAFFDAGKPVAAICHGPWTVIEAGAARGHRMTSWPSLRTAGLREARPRSRAKWPIEGEVVVEPLSRRRDFPGRGTGTRGSARARAGCWGWPLPKIDAP